VETADPSPAKKAPAPAAPKAGKKTS